MSSDYLVPPAPNWNDAISSVASHSSGALLDGLRGTPDIDLHCQGSLCAINLYPLQGYVKQRILALLAQAGAQVSQPVKLSGIIDNAAITYLERVAVAASRSVPLCFWGI